MIDVKIAEVVTIHVTVKMPITLASEGLRCEPMRYSRCFIPDDIRIAGETKIIASVSRSMRNSHGSMRSCGYIIFAR